MGDELRIPLPELSGHFGRLTRKLKFSALGTALLLVATGWLFLAASAGGVKELLASALGRWLPVISVAFGALIVLLLRLLTATTRRAAALEAGAEPILALDENGLHIPLALLTESALREAVKGGTPELALPWARIASWEVYGGLDNAPPQHFLRLTPEGPRIGRFNRFGIRRDPLGGDEREILAFVRRRGVAVPALT